MRAYLDLLQDILDNGYDHPDRTRVGRRTVIGRMLRFDISNGQFPLVTTRKVNPKAAIAEMLMFVSGITNVDYLNDHGVKIWNEWAVQPKHISEFLDKLVERGVATQEQAAAAMLAFDEKALGEIGPMYGNLWRHWPLLGEDIKKLDMRRSYEDLPSDLRESADRIMEAVPAELRDPGVSKEATMLSIYYSTVDQLNELILNLRDDPYSSRHVMTTLNPALTPLPFLSPGANVLAGKGALLPCHDTVTVNVKPPKEEGDKKRLSLTFTMRSTDAPVGLVFNLAGYTALAQMLAREVDMETDELIYFGRDVHIYLDQIELVREQLTRTPGKLPTMKITGNRDIYHLTPDDFELTGYEPQEAIKYPVAV